MAPSPRKRLADLPAALPEPAPIPGWARELRGGDTAETAMFSAAAALAFLHPLAHQTHPLGQLWRQRLALGCAAVLARQAGRREDEAQLRDHWVLRQPGDDPGPAGRVLGAWRALAEPRAVKPDTWAERLSALLGLGPEPVLDRLTLHRRGNPVALAAGVASQALRLCPDNPLPALWLGDAVLAQHLGWPAPVPLLAAHLRRADLRLGRSEAVDGWQTACATAWAKGALAAADLHADLARRGNRLLAVAPKLRGREAQAMVLRLLSEDALAAQAGATTSDRSARRFFDRLIAQGAVRELTGRASFRLYGL